MIEGYITYDSSSIFSPQYPHDIKIDNIVYRSPHDAIISGIRDINSIIYQYVNEYRDIYELYKNYLFSGIYSDVLNTAIQDILVTKIEDTNLNKYIYLIPFSINIPKMHSISVSRNIYILDYVRDQVYKQVGIIPNMMDTYDVYLIRDTPLYIGKKGSFFLLNSDNVDISTQLSMLKSH